MLTLDLESRPAQPVPTPVAEAAWAAIRADFGLNPDGKVRIIKHGGNTKLDHEMVRNPTALIASHTLPSGRVNGTCVNDTHCAVTCVVDKSFRATTSQVATARQALLALLKADADAYATLMVRDVRALALRADRNDQTLVVRPNVGSDVAWERWLPGEFWDAISDAGGHAYDYTKRIDRVGHLIPGVYRTTYSSTSATRLSTVKRILDRGDTVTAVLRQPANPRDKSVPPTFAGFPMVSGDATDNRFLDPAGVIVGLSAKGQLVRQWRRTGQWGALVATFDNHAKQGDRK